MFEKKIFIGNFSEKHVFPQKVPLETLSPFLITPLTIFRQKTVLSTKLWNPPPPPLLPPFWKKTIKLNIFQGIKFFQEQCIWTDKDTILTICFRSSKNICRKSRKCLEDIHSIKKNHLPEKTLQVFTIHFWQSCWSFSKILRDFVPKFYENTLLDFQKKYPIAYNFPGKKIAMKKNCFRQIKRNFGNRLKLCCQSTTKFRSISEKTLHTFIFSKKIHQ